MTKKRWFVLALVAGLAVVIGLTAYMHMRFRTLFYQGHTLRLVEKSTIAVRMEDENKNPFEATINTDAFMAYGYYGFTYLDKTAKLDALMGFDVVYHFSDGSSHTLPWETFFLGENPYRGDTPLQREEVQIFSRLMEYRQDNRNEATYYFYDFVALFCFCAGLAMAFYPSSFWRFRTFHLDENVRASSLGRTLTVIAGVLLVLGAIASRFFMFRL